MKVIIIGAGMAGLLAAKMLETRGHTARVLEIKSELPNNHNAVLRFRSNIVSDITGIPFRKVRMIKGTVPYINPVAEALAYSKKAFSSYRTDRSITNGFITEDRWIAPEDFIAHLAKGSYIELGGYQMQAFDIYNNKPKEFDAIISTIPMPKLMELLNYTAHGAATFEFEFGSTPGFVIKTIIQYDCEAYATLYTPDPRYPFYRVSITGNEMIAEFTGDKIPKFQRDIMEDALNVFGLNLNDIGAMGSDEEMFEAIPMTYAKIEPVAEDMRKRFMSWATDKHNVYSLGRYATWRPGLLLDDLVKDIKLIEGWISGGNNYDVRRDR